MSAFLSDAFYPFLVDFSLGSPEAAIFRKKNLRWRCLHALLVLGLIVLLLSNVSQFTFNSTIICITND
jgi:hypothetical protein